MSILKVAIMTPFFFFGFDVIPQAAEEIKVPLKKLGKLMLLSIILAVGFYVLVVFAVLGDAQLSYVRLGSLTADKVKQNCR